MGIAIQVYHFIGTLLSIMFICYLHCHKKRQIQSDKSSDKTIRLSVQTAIMGYQVLGKNKKIIYLIYIKRHVYYILFYSRNFRSNKS